MNPDMAYIACMGLMGCPVYCEITAHGRKPPHWIAAELPRPVERPPRADWPSTGHVLKGRYPSGFP